MTKTVVHLLEDLFHYKSHKDSACAGPGFGKQVAPGVQVRKNGHKILIYLGKSLKVWPTGSPIESDILSVFSTRKVHLQAAG